jgi:hypothetical protein
MRLAYLASGSLLLAACATTPAVPASLHRDSATTPARAASDEPADAPAIAPAAPTSAPAIAPAFAADFAPAMTRTPTLLEADYSPQGPPPPRPGGWRVGEAALQGYFGASFQALDTKGGAIANIDDDDVSFPTIGGGGQLKVAGDQVDFGFEGLISFSWRGNVSAFAVGGGGAAIAVDVDLLMWDFYGGPFVSAFLGDRTRIYAAAGPVMRWAIYDQDGPAGFSSGDGDGFGFGYYARTGIEFAVSRGTMVGVCARWTDVEVDLNGRLGDLNMHGIEALLTVSQGF